MAAMTSMSRAYATPEPSLTPNAPPPSLVSEDSSIGSKSKHYARNLLLSLATPKAPPPAPQRLASFSEIPRKDSTSDWGIDEGHSDILDGKPPARALAMAMSIPKQQELVGTPGQGHPADCLFNYRSTPGDAAVPILIDFANVNPFDKQKPASMSQTDVSSSWESDKTLVGDTLANSVGSQLGSIRLGARLPSISRSSSPTLSEGSARKRSGSFLADGGLNPFAAPWPRPSTTPQIGIDTLQPSVAPSLGHSSTTSDSGSEAGSLPLPKSLPSSLPKKPQCGLPPVFVKRESAALPQPMALPDIAPMGSGWEGENSLSGNEKRRRASQLGSLTDGLVLRMGSVSSPPPVGASESLGDTRPARLINLGQRIRANSVCRFNQGDLGAAGVKS